ncbi:MAG: hypothetical protein OXH12_00510 [Chloroflexi bacterium]|nr:hypothetical protein [Chloroflexota bacterium]
MGFVLGVNIIAHSASAEGGPEFKHKGDVLCFIAEICIDEIIQGVIDNPSSLGDAAQTVHPAAPVVTLYAPDYVDYVQDSVQQNAQPAVSAVDAYVDYVGDVVDTATDVGNKIVGFFTGD